MNKPTVKYNIAVVGATGLVGKRIIQFLESRNFPVNKLFCLASEKSMNTVIPFKSKMITVQNLKDFEFSFIHFTFFSAGSEVSKHYAPIAASYGSIVIDNTSYFRYENDIPLIIPEVNIEALSLYKKRRIIANPNCSTIQMLVALNPIHKQATLKRIEIATYQAVSGAGKKAMDELSHQTQCILDKKPIQSKHFITQIAFNTIPQIDALQDNGYTREEMKMIWETHKIFNNNTIIVNPTCVRVPVFSGHAEAVHIETVKPIQASEAISLLKNTPGIRLMNASDIPNFPTQAVDSEKHDTVLVGRIRNTITHTGLNLWIVANNLNKGAALNAIQIAEHLLDPIHHDLKSLDRTR